MSVGPIDLRRPDALELVRAGRVALLLGDVPGSVPDWFRRATAEKLGKRESRPDLDPWQEELVRLVGEVKARRARPLLPAPAVVVEDEWTED